MEGITIENLTRDDLPKLGALTPEGWTDISNVHAFYLENDFCNPTKVVVNGEIAGIGTALCYGKTGWLAHIIVAKPHRNKGLGTEIVKYLMRYLQETRSCESISLTATDLGYPVYQKQGFRVVSEYCVLQSERLGDESGLLENVREMSGSHHSDIFAIDSIVSGEDRRSILRPFLGKGYVCVDGEKVVGYYLPNLYEGPIAALRADAGIALLNQKMKATKKIALPIENQVGIHYLLDNGFTEKATIKRMVSGKPVLWNPRQNYSRIGGFSG